MTRPSCRAAHAPSSHKPAPMRSLVQRLKPLLLAAILAMALPVAGAHAQTGPANRKPEEEVSRLIAQGNYPAAERMALAELKRDASEEGPRSLRAALWYNRLGQVAQLDGRYERALERFRLSRDIRRDRTHPGRRRHPGGRGVSDGDTSQCGRHLVGGGPNRCGRNCHPRPGGSAR